VAKISAAALENEAIDGQPGPEAGHVIVLELANCREKVSPVPAPSRRRRWKTAMISGRTSSTRKPIRLLKQPANGRRSFSARRTWPPRRCRTRSSVAPTASRSRSTLPEVLRESSALYSASKVRASACGC